MKKIISLVLVLVLAVGVFAACGKGESSGSDASTAKEAGSVASGDEKSEESTSGSGGARELNLYTWAGVFPDDVLRDFETDTGIRINQSNFDYNETMHTKLQSGGDSDYDLIIGDDYILETIINEGLAMKLDTEKIPNIGNINPIYQSQYYDENNEYTVPYGSGVQTIVYDPSAPALEGLEIKGYKDLWNTALVDNIGMIGNFRVGVGMALKVTGSGLNSDNIEEITVAGEKLKELAPNIRLIKDDNLQDDLISGEVSVAIMYTSQVTMAKTANPEFKIVFPEEGIGFGIMNQFIPANAPNPDEAYEFINYILDPEVAARCFEGFGYYCTNKAAEEYISDEYKDMLIMPEEFLSNMEMMVPINLEANDKQDEIWSQFVNSI